MEITAAADQEAHVPETGPYRVLDLRRCELHTGFFSRCQFDTLADHLGFAREFPIDLSAASQTADLRETPYSGFSYWLMHLRGYADYLDAGEVNHDNTYVRYLTDYYAPQGQDPGLAADFGNPALILKRVRNRFGGFDFFREHEGQDIGAQVLPIRAIMSRPPPREPNVLCEVGSDIPIEARLVDGWHRIFAGRICRVRGLRCEVVEESSHLPELPGEIELGRIVNGHATVRGWCVPPDEVTVVELRAGAETMALSPMSVRPDIRRLFPQVLHAGTSGFGIDQAIPSSNLEHAPLALLTLSDWLPVGRISLRMTKCDDGAIRLDRSAPPTVASREASVVEIGRRLLHEPAAPGVAISPDDRSFKGDHEHYFAVGRSALNSIRLAMLACGKESAPRILDLSCGYGRVLRWLRAAFPDSEFTACDLNAEALDYCAPTFRAERAYLTAETAKLPPDATFDLIWCGTWMSHLTEARWRGFLELIRDRLSPSGLAVFTIHGRYVRDRMLGGSKTYGIDHLQIAGLIESYDRTGFGFAAYPDASGFGLAISSPSWVCARIAELKNLGVVAYTERGWDRHQDVVACLRI